MLNLLKTVLVTLLASLCVFSKSYAVTTTDFIPSWHEGDSWDVITRVHLAAMYGISGSEPEESRGAPEDIQFKVLAPQTIDGEMCYVLEITYKDPKYPEQKSSLTQLYVRQSDFTLKRLQKFVKKTDGTEKKLGFPIDNDHSFVIFETSFGVSIDIPLDFPDFNRSGTYTAKTANGYTVTQTTAFPDDNTMKKVNPGYHR